MAGQPAAFVEISDAAGVLASNTRALKEGGFGKAQVEGLPHADWVLIDAGDVIVHLFRPEIRKQYALEKMWGMELPPETAATLVAVNA